MYCWNCSSPVFDLIAFVPSEQIDSRYGSETSLQLAMFFSRFHNHVFSSEYPNDYKMKQDSHIILLELSVFLSRCTLVIEGRKDDMKVQNLKKNVGSSFKSTYTIRI